MSSAAVEEVLLFKWNATVTCFNDTLTPDVELVIIVDRSMKMGVKFV